MRSKLSRRSRRHGRIGGERASVLLLFPVAILVVLFLAALTFDASMAFLAKREAVAAATAAANDAAGALNRQDYFASGEYRIGDTTAQEFATRAVHDRLTAEYLHISTVTARVIDPTRVEVDVSGHFDLPFHALLGPKRHTFTVTGRADAKNV